MSREAEDLVEPFLDFDRNNDLARTPPENPLFDVNEYLKRSHPDASPDQLTEERLKLRESVPDPPRRVVLSAMMELLRSANFNLDIFQEFCKIVAYTEYLGNPLRIGINLYGSSGSGKTSFLTALGKTFNTGGGVGVQLTPRQLKEATTADNDPNARAIGSSFVTFINEENNIMVNRFKSYVDVGTLVTRDIHSTQNTAFPIRAKVLFCTINPLQVEDATDDGFYTRYYPIHLTYAFKDYEPGLDRLVRHRIEALVPSKYLGDQLIMNLHPGGRTPNLAEKLEFWSHHLLSVVFFSSLNQPVPKTQTCEVRDDYIKYFARTNPLKLFHRHAHIEYYHTPMSESKLQEILERWWENNKNRIEHKFTANSSFSKWLNKIDYFSKYRQNDQYYMKLQFSVV